MNGFIITIVITIATAIAIAIAIAVLVLPLTLVIAIIAMPILTCILTCILYLSLSLFLLLNSNPPSSVLPLRSPSLLHPRDFIARFSVLRFALPTRVLKIDRVSE